MRNVINISLPAPMVKEIRQEVKKGEYASVSEFFRHLIRLWNTHKLGNELLNDRADFEYGKGKVLKSLENLD